MHNIYKRGENIRIGDLWEIILAEEFEKIFILQKKLTEIL